MGVFLILRVFFIDARDAPAQNRKLFLKIAHSPFLCPVFLA
jgi:hypothetical protein